MFGGKIFREGRLTFSLSLFSLFFPQKYFSRKTHFHENETKQCLEKKYSEGVGRLFLCLFFTYLFRKEKVFWTSCFRFFRSPRKCSKSRKRFEIRGNTLFFENEKRKHVFGEKSSEGVGRLLLCLLFALIFSVKNKLSGLIFFFVLES